MILKNKELELLMMNTVELWILLTICIGLLITLARFGYSKLYKTDITSAAPDTILEVRNKIIAGITNAVLLSDIKKEKGNIAVKSEISNQIRTIINETELLTDSEKIIISNLNIVYFVDIVEKELLRLGILKE